MSENTRINKFERIAKTDEKLAAVQDSIEEILDNISSIEILNGRVVENVLLTSGIDNKVAHGLGRIPIGYVVIRQSADARIWNYGFTGFDDRFITLQSSTNVYAYLWVF